MADWRNLLLSRLGAPQSATNLEALQLWADSEGIAASAHNPLAAEDLAAGSTPYPPSPKVQQYVSDEEAVIVYAHKFASGTYATIGVALSGDRGLQAIFDAINHSPWCAGCQDGHYPNALYAALPHTTTTPPTVTPCATTDESLNANAVLTHVGNAAGYDLPAQLVNAVGAARRFVSAVR